jgi:hypothetical protein
MTEPIEQSIAVAADPKHPYAFTYASTKEIKGLMAVCAVTQSRFRDRQLRSLDGSI